MALRKFGFIVTGGAPDASRHRMAVASSQFEMIAVGVSEPSQGLAVARELVDDGVQLLELCGGFGPVWPARVIEAIGGAVPVGSLEYGAEAIAPMQPLFSA